MSINWVTTTPYERPLDLAREELILGAALEKVPSNTALVKRLASVLTEQNRFDEAVNLVLQFYDKYAPSDPEFECLVADMFVRTGDFEKALSHYLASGPMSDQTKLTQAMIAWCYIHIDQAAQALEILNRLTKTVTTSFPLCQMIFSGFWQLKELDAALAFGEKGRVESENYTLYESFRRKTLLRKYEGDRNKLEQLFEYDRLVREIDLYEVNGELWRDENTSALAQYTSDYRKHMLTGSGGVQSTVNGWRVNIGDDQNELVRPLLMEVKKQIASYLQEVNMGGHFDSQTEHSAALGSWYIVFKKEGYLKPHIHLNGTVSGVYYVSIPESIKASKGPSQGWLRFGYEHGMGPEKYVKPQEGKLVLFPSYVSHHTVPTTSDEERICFSFDAILK